MSGSESRSDIVDAMFNEYLTQKLNSNGQKDENDRKRHKSHKKHKHKEKYKEEDNNIEDDLIRLNTKGELSSRLPPKSHSSDSDNSVSLDTGFFAKEGFLAPDSKSSSKMHKKHKHKHKHKKDKKKSKEKDKSKTSRDSSPYSSSKGDTPPPLSPTNERALQLERDMRNKLINLRANLTKKHKALEEIAKAPPVSPPRKVTIYPRTTPDDNNSDKQNEQPAPVKTIVKDAHISDGNRETSTNNECATDIQLDSIALPPPKEKQKEQRVEKGDKQGTKDEKREDQNDADGFKAMLPRSVRMASAEDNEAEDGDSAKQPSVRNAPATGMKRILNLKISASSASLISSGVMVENDSKKKNMEDGELTESPKSSDTEPDSPASNHRDSSDGEVKDGDSKAKEGDSKAKKKRKREREEGERRRSSKRSRERSRSPSRHTDRSSRHKDRSRSPKKSKKKSRSRSRSRSFDEVRGIWKDEPRSRRSRRSRSRERSRKRSRRSRDSRRSRSRSRSPYSSSRPFYARGPRDRSRSRSRDRSRKRSRSPSDKRLKIDPIKLRQIAMKNAYAAVHEGKPLNSLASDQIAALKAGGKSLDELTEFCKKITEREALRGLSGRASDSDDEAPSGGIVDDDSTFMHHPFAVREPTKMEITMRIRNAKQLPVSSFAERQEKAAELRIQFPVSSGTVHKGKEAEWTPVPDPPVKSAAAPKPVAAAAPVPAPTTEAALMPPPPAPPLSLTQPPAAQPAAPVAKPNPADKIITLDEPKVEPLNKVFPEDSVGPVNIGQIVSERLSAMRKLQENPHDVEAMGVAFKAQKAMDSWALSKHQPGQWVGGTGIRKTEDLHKSGYQAWIRKDQFTSAAPVRGGIGMALLQKMGWKQGEGLGKDKKGDLEPINLELKCDRKGLSSQGEAVPVKKAAQPNNLYLNGKHPVSALMELTKRRGWLPPDFQLAFEHGPPHQKNFVFKVKVSDTWYQPSVASSTKKVAKAEAATCALQSFGLLPKNVP